MNIIEQLSKELSNIKLECPECKGSGWVQSIEWQEYWEKYNKRVKSLEEEYPYLSFLDVYKAVDDELEDEMPDVPEETVCPECYGNGFVLTEEGKSFISLLKHYLSLEII